MMIPILYKKDETSFTHRGLGTLLDTLSCIVKEEKNGLYELELIYPLDGSKNNLINYELIIKANTPKGEQLFRIYRVVEDIESNTITVNAKHIFYDLLDNFVEDTNIVGKNGAGALNQLLSNTQFTHKFSATSDISKTNNSRIVRKNVVEAILDTGLDNSLINRWGGELERDNFTIRLFNNVGADRGVAIKYGKNLLGLNVDVNISDVVTRVMPQGYDGLFLDELYVDSPYINNYVNPKIRKYEFSSIKAIPEGELSGDTEEVNYNDADIVTYDDSYLPRAEALALLKKSAEELFSIEKIDIPKTTVKVDFVELSKSEEYKDYAVLERIYPLDTITVKHNKLNINIKVQLVYYEWDSLNGKYLSMTLGNAKADFTSSTPTKGQVNSSINNSYESALDEAKKNATDIINLGLNGNVIKRRGELLIMDTTDINTARKLWRWNLGGLGFSSTGYNGPYGIAITNDGKIVADFITTGVLNADLIKAGTLTAITISSEDGTSYWNLDTGTINLNKGSITGSNSSWNLDTGAISFTKGKISGSNSSWDLDSQIIQGSNVKINLADGNVSFSKGKISGSNSWWDLSTGECYFDKGTIKSATGSMNLGNGAVSFGNGNFTVGTNGNVNIKGQKITFLSGSTIYDNGSTFTLNGNGNSIFIQSTSSNWIRIANGFVDFGGTVTFANSIETNGITNSGNIKSGTITSTGKASISGDIWGYATLDIDGASYLRSSVDVYGITRCHSNLICQGSLAVNGTKNRIVDTENYGKLKLNAYETAESYFGDIGESETDHNGIKKIYLDSMFLETVNTSVPYQVFLTCYSDTDINLRVIERAEKYFVVKGAPNCSFGFEIKAKQKGYEKDRLEVFEEEIEEMSVNKEKIKNKKGE